MENHGVKWGVISGVGVVAFSLVLYLVNPTSLFGGLAWAGMIIYIFGMVKAAQGEKNDLGGYMSWGEALKPTFLTYAIASLIYIVFFYVLNNFIDPGLEDLQREAAIEMIENMSGLIGEEGVEEAIAQADEQGFKFGIKNAAMGYFIGLIFPGFIIAAIISAIVKKNRPDMA